jgi:selenocysteine-specific elongation factor
LASLELKERGDSLDQIAGLLEASPLGLTRRAIAAASALPEPEAATAIDKLVANGAAVGIGAGRFLSAAQLKALTSRAESILADYHARYPLRKGMPREEFRSALGRNIDPKALGSLISYWQSLVRIEPEEATLRLSTFQVALNERQELLSQRIEDFYVKRGISIPTLQEVVDDVHAPLDAVTAMLTIGVERRRFHHLSPDQYMAEKTLSGLKDAVTDYVGKHGTITVSAFRDLTGSNRRFSMVVLEYLDHVRFTRRTGDERVLAR